MRRISPLIVAALIGATTQNLSASSAMNKTYAPPKNVGFADRTVLDVESLESVILSMARGFWCSREALSERLGVTWSEWKEDQVETGYRVMASGKPRKPSWLVEVNIAWVFADGEKREDASWITLKLAPDNAPSQSILKGILKSLPANFMSENIQRFTLPDGSIFTEYSMKYLYNQYPLGGYVIDGTDVVIYGPEQDPDSKKIDRITFRRFLNKGDDQSASSC
jgi:hypothetical protein